jgi:outer membrane protein assembly factor BamB
MSLCSSVALEAQWPQWRGPARDGSVLAASTPKWPATWKRAWRVDVGEGYSSPVVAGGRAFVHSRRDPDELVTAIDVATGTVAWQQKYTTPFNKNQYAASMAKGPHATPLVIGDKVFTFGGMGVLTAWHAQTGAVAWRKDYSSSVDTSKLFTLAQAAGKWLATEAWKNADVAMYMSTPVLADGVLYGLSSKKKGQVFALDAATGDVKWMTEGRAADQAAILLTPAHVLILTTGGELVLVKRSAAKYEEERRYTVADSATWAVPVLLPDGLIVRDASSVMRLTSGL